MSRRDEYYEETSQVKLDPVHQDNISESYVGRCRILSSDVLSYVLLRGIAAQAELTATTT